MSTTIESLQIQVDASAQNASSGLDALTASLEKVKNATKGGLGLTSVASQLGKLNQAMGKLSSLGATNLKETINALSGLKTLQGVKVSSTIARSIAEIGDATSHLGAEGVVLLREIVPALSSLSAVKDVRISANIGKQLGEITKAASAINTADLGKIAELSNAVSSLANLSNIRISSSIATQVINLAIAAEQMQGIDLSIFGNLAEALHPLSTLDRVTNLASTLTQLKKLPEIMSQLAGADLATFKQQIQELATALAPLATNMQSIANGFAAFPQRIQRLIQTTNRLSQTNMMAAQSYVNLYAQIHMAVTAVRSAARIIASWINNSNEYIENLNLFTVSMGEYADEAQRYAERVGELMGIDPSTWMRNQGVFMTLATGFGVASDRAYIMSQNLTQLGYDLSSFFNITVDDAMQKLQSGISGELEPLRRLGYDLSEARLKAAALELGITQTYSAMTQAEKSQLRYYAIMTQVTSAQGDMARTLNAPANQLRVLQAQIGQAARALGNVFIPILNAVLPYCIALAKAIRLVAAAIASLFGFTLPEIDYSGIGAGIDSAAGGAGDLADNLGGAGDNAKKLKSYLMGFDELNIIDPTDSSGGGGGGGCGGGGGDWDWDLPAYDFLDGLVSSRVDAIFNQMKPYIEWIVENFDDILATVGAIGAGLLAWKITNQVTDGVGVMSKLATWFAKNKMGMGIGLTITSAILAFKAGVDIGYEGATLPNVIKAVAANLGAFVGGCMIAGLSGGVLALTATLLLTLTGAALGIRKKQVEQDLLNRFGDISLTVEQITALVQKQIDKGLIDSIKLYLDIDTQLLENLKTIKTARDVLNFFNWKVNMGIALTPEEATEYQSTIDSYVTECLNYVTQRGYKIDIAIKAAFPDQVDENGQTLYLGNAMVTQLLTDELTRLGTELQTIVNQAFDNDGLLDIDEVAAVERIMGEMNAIMEMVSKSKVEAKLAMIDLEYGGAQLTQESYTAYIAELGALKSTLETDAKTVIEGTIADLTINLEIAEAYLEEDPTNEEYQQAVAECERALNDYIALNPLQAKIDEINLTIEQNALTGWEKLFGDLFDNVSPELSQGFSHMLSSAFNPENFSDEELEQLRLSGNDILAYVYDGSQIAENFKAYLSDMLANAMGEEHYQIVAESAVQLEITDWEWKVLDDTIQLSLYQQMSEAFGAKATKDAFAQLGYDLTGVIAEGVKNADSIIEDSAGDIVITLKDGTQIALNKNDSVMTAMFNSLGVDLVDGMVAGIDGEMTDSIKTLLDIFGIPYDKAAEENEVNSPSELFKRLGTYIVEGLIAGLGTLYTKLKDTWTTLPSWFQTFINKIVGMFTGMNVDVGDLFEDTKDDIQDAWSPVSGWFGTNVTDPTKSKFSTLATNIISLLLGAKTDTETNWQPMSSWFSKIVSSPIGKIFTTLGSSIVSLFTDAKDDTESAWSPVSGWFGTNVKNPIVALFTRLGFKNIGSESATGLKEGLLSIDMPVLQPLVALVRKGWETVSGWVHGLFGNTNNDESVSLLKSGWTTVSSWVKSLMGNTDVTKGIGISTTSAWSTVSSWISNNKMGGSVTKAIGLKTGFLSGVATVAAWLLLDSIFGGSVTKNVNLGKGNWAGKSIARWCADNSSSETGTVTVNLAKGNWSSLSSFITSDWRRTCTVNLKKGNSLTYTITTGTKSISIRKDGGFVDAGQMFIAREAGPELVGNIGGRTAVANNDQIVEAVAAGVYGAVSQAMYEANGNGGNSRIVVNLDGKTIYENQQGIARGRGYDLGMGAFSFG